jgi:hypothetical protein
VSTNGIACKRVYMFQSTFVRCTIGFKHITTILVPGLITTWKSNIKRYVCFSWNLPTTTDGKCPYITQLVAIYIYISIYSIYICIYNLQQNGLKKNCKFEDLLLQEPTVPNVLQGISLTFAVLLGNLEMLDDYGLVEFHQPGKQKLLEVFTLPTLSMPMKKTCSSCLPVHVFLKHC